MFLQRINIIPWENQLLLWRWQHRYRLRQSWAAWFMRNIHWLTAGSLAPFQCSFKQKEYVASRILCTWASASLFKCYIKTSQGGFVHLQQSIFQKVTLEESFCRLLPPLAGQSFQGLRSSRKHPCPCCTHAPGTLGQKKKQNKRGRKASSTIQLLPKIVFESRVQGYTAWLTRGLPASQPLSAPKTNKSQFNS